MRVRRAGDGCVAVACGAAEGHEHLFAVGLTLRDLGGEALGHAVEQAGGAGGGLGACCGAAVGTLVKDGPAAGAEEGGYEGEDDDVDVGVGADCVERDGGGLVSLAVVDCDVVTGHWIECV